MHLHPWYLYAAVVLIAWGVVGIFQKLATNHISAGSTLVLLIVGFLLFEPFVYPGSALFHYSARALAYGLIGGFLNNLGAWALFAAMESGGKASIVAPFTALYPLVVVLLAPLILHESVTLPQAIGVGCSLVAVVLLSM